jgi:DnaJ-class molecular chaperone
VKVNPNPLTAAIASAYGYTTPKRMTTLRHYPCPRCNGKGGGMTLCPVCHGAGRVSKVPAK